MTRLVRRLFDRSTRGAKTTAPSLRHRLALAALCLMSGAVWAGPSATVLFTTGEARVISAKGESRELKTGAQIDSGETVQTGKGRVQLRMIDGALMALSEQTTLRLDDYRVATTPGGEERGFMSLVRGTLRTISGSIGHPRQDDYRLDTPAGTIGIRGTEYTASLGGKGDLEVGVIGGRVAVCNDGGCVDVPKGFAATTPSRSVKPAVAAKPLVLLTPTPTKATATATAPTTTTTADAASTEKSGGETTASSAVASAGANPSPRTTPSGGEQVSQYLIAALTPPATAAPAPATPGDPDALPSLPGSTTVTPAPASGSAGNGAAEAPVVIVPRPAAPVNAPGTTPGTTPAPAPGTGTPPAPGPGTAPSPGPAPTPGAGGTPGSGSAPAPAPGAGSTPAPGPGTPPAPGPITNPPPGPVTPLPNGKATIGLVWSTEGGKVANGLTQGTVQFNAQGGLTTLANASTGKPMLEKGTPVDVGANGVIGWGRWTGGDSKVAGTSNGKGAGNGHLATLHYFAIADLPTGPVSGTFTSFASTAPTVQADGKLVAIGAVNGATGSFNASLQLQLGGNASYSLTVPVANQTFSLVGVATQTSASGFSGVSLITSTGTGCAGGCTGSLGNNVSVMGQLAGSTGSQAGVLYGFDTRIGNVSGVIVFKR
ncbi:FecR family protein [Roseateles terrae]|uniref:Ferric-dicitrate binding protein FerR (Iron transport regulator) n=1 Tax=Roseateles terrae TaxID=431060 RepID=A0ABR6GTM8_9BURK|nr:FecR family protein [Roseateles terrae]MBB3195458.1 ferric-dicitrate binding protein FerR (iron transport regulator) [Roseateles terrae]OWQ86391.1 hypothetical protein CDN98_11525 [Roseateles terrae]